MAVSTLKILMNGVTGALGASAHLASSILAIRNDGGITLGNGDVLMPEPVLLGRDAAKLASLSSQHGGLEYTTDLDTALADPSIAIYFDTSVTTGRFERTVKALEAGKHVYIEKPVAESLEQAQVMALLAKEQGVKNGTVQDKVFLPGIQTLKSVLDSGQLGAIHAVRLNFGWWIFDGIFAEGQRPSWNFTARGGGGIVLDMSPHWTYIVETLFGDIASVSCRIKTAVPLRRNETGEDFAVDVEDEFFATYELVNGVLVNVCASWAVRVKQDDLLTIQVDGALGSARCGLHRCYVQSLADTPVPLWDVETPGPQNYDGDWIEHPPAQSFLNSYRAGWEAFLRHVAEDAPFPSPLVKGARGLAVIDACYRSDAERRWIDVEQQ